MSADDPVADFLAREQDDLAGLEDDAANLDLGGGDADVPVVNGTAAETLDFDSFGGGETTTDMNPEQLNDFDQFQSAQQPGTEDDLPPMPTPAASAPRPMTPEKIRKWRDEQKERLSKKDENEEKKRKEWQAVAKKELDDWYTARAEQFHAHKKTNREAEAELVRERDSVAPGKDWERITKLCEFNPKNSKNTKDVSRFRSLLLQMKGTEAN